jgi:hypothetical protein
MEGPSVQGRFNLSRHGPSGIRSRSGNGRTKTHPCPSSHPIPSHPIGLRSAAARTFPRRFVVKHTRFVSPPGAMEVLSNTVPSLEHLRRIRDQPQPFRVSAAKVSTAWEASICCTVRCLSRRRGAQQSWLGRLSPTQRIAQNSVFAARSRPRKQTLQISRSPVCGQRDRVPFLFELRDDLTEQITTRWITAGLRFRVKLKLT